MSGRPDVEHDQAGPVGADRGRDLFAARGLHDPVAVAPKVQLDQIGDVRLVVDDEDRPALHVSPIVSLDGG